MKRDTLIIAGAMLVAVALGVALFLRWSSSNASLPAAAGTQASAGIVPFTPLAHGMHSTVAVRVNYCITSADQLSKLWKMIDATSTPPHIDFATHSVVAVFAGKQSVSGYAIAVSKVSDSSTRLVSVMLAKPDGSCAPARTSIAPYDIVAVPLTALPLEHEDIVTAVQCAR